MKNLNALLIILGLTILVTGCRKDAFDTNTNTTPPTPIDYYETSIEGYVVDSNDQPLSDVTITLGTATTSTNGLGYFHIKGLGNSNYSVVSASLNGYFDNYETYIPSRDVSSVSQTRIKLTQRLASGTIQSSNGGEISIGGESKVTFQPNSIIREDGSAYDGPVIIYAHEIDPTRDDINDLMPGNLMSRDADDEIGVLKSYGMVNIELQSPSGEDLNISQPATITVDIPESLESSAPAELPLWYFDETVGLWIEDGTATRQGGIYEGEVTHFTPWNVDEPFNDVIFISGRIVDSEGVPAVEVFIEDVTTGLQISLWTDSDGEFFGVVPVDMEYTIFVKALCDFDGFLYSDNIGPFSESADLGDIDVSNNNGYTTVSGIIVDCDMNPVANGQVYFNYPGFSYSTETVSNDNGFFSLLIPSCEGEEVEIRAVNPETSLVSGVIVIEINGESQDLGSIDTCIDVSPTLGSVTLQYDGQVKEFDNCVLSIGDTNFGTQYAFVYYDFIAPLQKQVQYIIAITDANRNIDSPDWSFFGPLYTVPDNPDEISYTGYYPRFFVGMPEITVSNATETVGQIMELQISNVELNVVTEPSNMNTLYSNTVMSIEAVITQ